MAKYLEMRLRTLQKRYERAPQNSAILHEICKCLITLKRDEEMLPWSRRALELNPHDVTSLTRCADALYLLGRYAEALRMWEQDPSQNTRPVLHRLRLGMNLMMAGHITRAISVLNEAWLMAQYDDPELSASVRFAMGEAMLKAGNPLGFSGWIMRNHVPRLSFSYSPPDIPEWDGESELHGKRVLITHELGFGDNFLLAARVRDWLEAGTKIMMTCNPLNHGLMQASLPHCDVISAPNPGQQYAPLPEHIQKQISRFSPDVHATLLHLPLLSPHHSGREFRPYIQAPSQQNKMAEKWAQQLRTRHPGKKLVGFFWDCTQRHWPEMGAVIRCWAQRRSLPIESVNEIILHPAVTDCVHFVNLHHPAATDLAGIPSGNMSSYLPGIRDFSDTAACIAQMDAVVAVDSGVANLAAMMGGPTCVPVHSSGDWRWGVEGTSSPWIKDVTVLRQTNEGNWNNVVQHIRTWLLR